LCQPFVLHMQGLVPIKIAVKAAWCPKEPRAMIGFSEATL